MTTKLKNFILNKSGHFGQFGGRYVPEVLVPVFATLAAEFQKAIRDPKFRTELKILQREFAARPTPLLFCQNLTQKLGGAKIFLKNEGALVTGAHKINHCLGQALLAKRLGKTRIIAETGAGQHGLATATVCAKLGLECLIFMGARDVARQRPNVFWMERLGAKVQPVEEGTQTLRAAINAALRELMREPVKTHYLLGTACGAHPYPIMNVFFQKIIGEEVRREFQQRSGKLPDKLVACVGGGSNALGFFHAFLDDKNVELIGVEAGGQGPGLGEHAARFAQGSPGIAEGMQSIFLQDSAGQLAPTHSISAGLDFVGVSPQLAYLQKIGRVRFTSARDKAVLRAFQLLARTEGLFPALESAHALAEVCRLAPKMRQSESIIFNLSGRGDKDLFILARELGDENFRNFLKNCFSES